METAGGRKAKEESAVSAIGPGVVIRGEVSCAIDLQIEGEVHGDVRCPTLLLGEGGVVNGSVHAERVRLAGRVEGTIDAGDLAVEATAYIEGDVTYARLKVTPGGRVRGRMEPRDEAAAAAPEPAPLKLVEPMSEAPTPQAIRVFGE